MCFVLVHLPLSARGALTRLTAPRTMCAVLHTTQDADMGDDDGGDTRARGGTRDEETGGHGLRNLVLLTVVVAKAVIVGLLGLLALGGQVLRCGVAERLSRELGLLDVGRVDFGHGGVVFACVSISVYVERKGECG